MKKYPELYRNRGECCGCGACRAVCPKDAITMVEDSEGFLYPRLDKTLCVGCFSCLKVCPFKEPEE